MKKNKIFSTLASMLLVVSFLTSCTGGTKTSTEANTTTETKVESSVDEKNTETETSETGLKHYGDVKLKFLNAWNGGVQNPSDTYNNDVAKAIRDKIGVTVEVEGIMMSEVEKLNLIFASGDMPDIISVPYWGGTGGETGVIKKAASEGLLLPLDGVIEQFPNISMAWDVGIVSQAFLENDLEPEIFGGKHYILPVETPAGPEDITNWTYGIFARKDIIEAIGIDPRTITTSDKLYEFLEKVRDGGFKDVNGNPIIPLGSFGNGWALNEVTNNFDNMYSTDLRMGEDGKFVTQPFTDEFTDAVKFMRNLVANNILDKEAFRQSDTLAEEKVGNGTVGVIATQYGRVINATKKSGFYENNPEMKYLPIGPLTYKNGDPLVQRESFGRGGTPAFVFTTANQNLEASLAWVDYINSDEGRKLIYYGFEGDTYNLVDGKPRFNAEIIARKVSGDPSIDQELKNRGIGLYSGRLVADKNLSQWGEQNPGDSEAADKDWEAYKLLRPVLRVEGYPITAKINEFPEMQAYVDVFAGDVQRNAQEQAYFAKTEEEALKIIEDFRTRALKAENGVVQKYWDFMTELYKSREDFIY